MGLEELKGTKYGDQSVLYGISKANALFSKLMKMFRRKSDAISIDDKIKSIFAVEDEKGITTPDGTVFNSVFMNAQAQNAPEESGSYKVFQANKDMNARIKRASAGAGEMKPVFDLADTMSNSKGCLLEACMQNRYLGSMIDSLTTLLPKLNDPANVQGLAGNDNKGPLKSIKGLYTGLKEMIDLDYTRQKNERENWPGSTRRDYTRKLISAQKKTIEAYETLCKIKNPGSYNAFMSDSGNAGLAGLIDEIYPMSMAMASLKAEHEAIKKSWAPEDARVFGILAEIEHGLNIGKKGFANFKKASGNRYDPQSDNYFAEAEKDMLALKKSITDRPAGVDMQEVMGSICSYVDKYKNSDPNSEMAKYYGSFGQMLKEREENYTDIRKSVDARFYADLDRKMEISTHGVRGGTREYDNIRRSVAEFGTLMGEGKELGNPQQKESYNRLKKDLLKYIVRKEAEIAGKKSPNRNSVMRLTTMKTVFNSLASRFEPELVEKKRVNKRTNEYEKFAQDANLNKKTRPVYRKLNELNTLITGHMDSGAVLGNAELNALAESYKTAIASVDNALKNKKTASPGLRKLAKKLGKDYRTINKFIKNNREANINDIYERSRSEAIEIEDYSSYEKKGNALSQRVKMELDGKTGFFTAESVPEDFDKVMKGLKKSIPVKYGLFDGYFDGNRVSRLINTCVTSNYALYNDLLEGDDVSFLRATNMEASRALFRDSLKSELLSQNDAKNMDELTDSVRTHINSELDNFDAIFGRPSEKMSEEQKAGFISVIEYTSNFIEKINSKGIREKIVGKNSKESTDRRNSAMSDMADLFGMEGLIVHTENKRLKDKKTGKTIKGIFMDEAKGIDPANFKYIDEMGRSFDHEKVSDSLSLKKDIANLQILDFICGNVDRHRLNYFFKKDENGKVCGLIGIDNDVSFGLHKNVALEMSGISPENMMVIPKSTWDKIKDMNSETMKATLYGFGISAEAIDNSVKRFEQIKAKIAADQEFYKSQGAYKGELIDGRIKVVDDEELEALAFGRQLADDSAKARQLRKTKNIFAEVWKASGGSMADDHKAMFFDEVYKLAGASKKAWASARTVLKDTDNIKNGDNAFAAIHDYVKGCDFSDGFAAMSTLTPKKRSKMLNKISEIDKKCDTYLESMKNAQNPSEDDKKRIKAIKAIKKNVGIIVQNEAKCREFDKIQDKYSNNSIQEIRDELYDLDKAAASKELYKMIETQKAGMENKMSKKLNDAKKPDPSFLEEKRDSLKIDIVNKMHDLCDSRKWPDYNDYLASKREIMAELIVLKTVEMNLAKGKKGEIKYCGADVSNEQLVKTSIDTLKNSKDIKDMAKDFEFDGDLKKVKAVGEKFINPAIKTKTLADNFLTDVENTLAKKTAVKAAGK